MAKRTKVERLVLRVLLARPEGVNLIDFWTSFELLPSTLAPTLRKLQEEGLLQFDESRVSLTEAGRRDVVAHPSSYLRRGIGHRSDYGRASLTTPHEVAEERLVEPAVPTGYRAPQLAIGTPVTPIMSMVDPEILRRRSVARGKPERPENEQGGE